MRTYPNVARTNVRLDYLNPKSANGCGSIYCTLEAYLNPDAFGRAILANCYVVAVSFLI